MPKIPLRKIRVKGNIAHVPLNRGYVAVIDAEDVPLVAGYNWTVRTVRGLCYAFRTDRSSGYRQRRIHLHRVIARTPKRMHVDHIDGDGLNNRRANLRNVTPAENSQNRNPVKTHGTGYTGVAQPRGYKKYIASITVQAVRHKLGTFDTPEDAAKAYQEASERLRGDLARR